MKKRILIIVTNRDHYLTEDKKTGLWLSELVHFYDIFEKEGFHQDIVSPSGGDIPLDPRSLSWTGMDKSTKKRYNDLEFMKLLKGTKSTADVNWEDYDVVYYAGGHGVMWDFPEDNYIQEINKNMYENGKVIAAVCHGYCGLLETRLSDGRYLVNGKKLTGFSWNEEVLAMVSKQMPYNVEEEMKKRGALYKKHFLPFVPKVVIDNNLIKGQNPNSAKKTAKAVLEYLHTKHTKN